MKRIYSVEISLTVMVCAESGKKAEEHARRWLSDIVSQENHNANITAHCEVTNPADDEAAGIPWGDSDDDDPDRTVGEWVALAKAAPPADPRQVTLPGVSL